MFNQVSRNGWAILLIPFVILALAIAVTSTHEIATYPRRTVPGGDASQGPQAIRDYGCGSCHTIPGVKGANGKVGPPLVGLHERSYIAGVLPNTPDNLTYWIINPQQVDPNVDMPNLGVTESDARNIAAYLYTLDDD